jgi:nicotinate-nucleotide adenylyltransferase
VVGLLGGSFDPLYHRHLLTGMALCNQLALQEVRLIPSGAQPFKVRHHAPAEDRLRMVELAVAGQEGLSVERVEVDRPGRSYTVETLRVLRARDPDQSWCLLVGSDAAAEFAQWHEADAIPGLARVVFFRRAGGELPPVPDVEWVDVPAIDISATAVRARVRDGRSLRYWVPDVVAEYIATHRLYRDIEG